MTQFFAQFAHMNWESEAAISTTENLEHFFSTERPDI